MVKNDFRVTSIFEVIIRVCMKHVEFCRTTSTSLPKSVRGRVRKRNF